MKKHPGKIFRKEKSVITNSEECYCAVLGEFLCLFIFLNEY